MAREGAPWRAEDEPDLRVVLVEPRYSANVGAIARTCANFGVSDLVIVGDVELTDPARIMAVHAKDLLEDVPRAASLAQALEGADYALAFTALTTDSPEDHLRDGVLLPEAAERVGAMEGTTALVFGREDYGLFNDEIAACDLVTAIPVSPDYPSINLSHAVAVALYELAGRPRPPHSPPRSASTHQVELMLGHAAALARATGFREHKVLPTVLALRRVVGRARLSAFEYHRLMGLFSKALKALDAWPIEEDHWSSTEPTISRGVAGNRDHATQREPDHE